MGINRADVEMLNRSMEGLGQSFVQKRQLDEQHSRDIAREMLEQKMLENSERRLTAEQGREDILGQGTVETYLQAPDGQGVIKFHGPQKGLDTLIQSAAQKGKTLTPMSEPPATRPFAVIKTTTPIGDLEFHAQDAAQLGKITEQVQKMGGKAPGHASSQYGPIAADREATALEDKAGQIEQSSASGNTPGLEGAMAAQQEAKALRDRAKALRSTIGKTDPTQMETVTETQEPALGSTEPKRTISRKVPVGSASAPAATKQGGNAGGLRQQAQEAIKAGKDPKAVAERFKKLTGQNL